LIIPSLCWKENNMAVVASATGAAVFGLSGVAAGLAGGALLGAGIGGLYSAVTGDGDILNSMLTGGLIGGAAGGLGAGYAGATAATSAAEAATAAGATGTGAVGPAATVANTATPALTGASTPAGAVLANASADPILAASNLSGMTAADIAAYSNTAKDAATAALTGKEVLGYGLAGTAAMQMLGGRGKGGIAPASATDPGMIRPYEFNPNQTAATGSYPSPYVTAQYDAAGMPIMDTRERNYFDQKYTAQTPYSARAGTANPNPPIAAAASGGLMAVGGPVERMSRNVMGGQGNMFPQSQQDNTYFATPTQMPASAEVIRSDYDTKTNPYTGVMMAAGGIARFADKGMVDEEAELRKIVANNLKKLSPDQMKDVMGFAEEGMREKQFLMKNMPNYAAAMSPSISSMVEGAQYGDRMAQSSGNEPRTVNVMPRVQDADNYGGIASIGRQLDPNTRVNMMADFQRTPYDKNALESVRRVGAGIDRKIGKDANLAAYYEQDPMGRSKVGGVRYTQQFNMGGATDLGDYSDGGRLLKGPGDGVSDDIPATIAGKQPARLADGEFVIPARIVSEIGNGSTDAGAKRLYAMMDRIQEGRKKTIGKKNVAKDTKAKKHLLA
jgi:hypothetical protein